MPNLVGIGNSQVPTNAMLGGLAYQDSVGEIDIDKIKAKTSDTATAIFVYDTRNDSDGGAWRHRTQNTSWYNESPSATRGARKEFPAVAVIVAQQQKLTIYDGDDPNLPMWMHFEFNTYSNGSSLSETPIGLGKVTSHPYRSLNISSVHMLNGYLFIGGNRVLNADSSHAGYDLNFISELMHEYISYPTAANRTTKWELNGNIAQRNSTETIPTPTAGRYNNTGTSRSILGVVNDVAMIVEPNAKTDPYTKLPIPTLAVATHLGTTIVRGNGVYEGETAVDIVYTSGKDTQYVDFRKSDNALVMSMNANSIYVHVIYEIPTSNKTGSHYYQKEGIDDEFYRTASSSNWNQSLWIEGGSPASTGSVCRIANNVIAGNGGINVIAPNRQDHTGGMVAEISHSYNSGYMFSDHRGAFLADTVSTNITATTVTSNWATAGSWNYQSQKITLASDGAGGINITHADGGGSYVYSYLQFTVEADTDYMIQVDFTAYNSGDLEVVPAPYNSNNERINLHAVPGLSKGGQFGSGSNTTLYLMINHNSTSTTTIKDVVVQKITDGVSDRSKSNKDLLVVGTINRAPVAAGAELVSYQPADSNSYLEGMKSTSSLGLSMNFSNAWYMMFWYNTHGKMSLENYSTSSYNNTILMISISDAGFYLRGDVGTVNLESSPFGNTEGWNQVVTVYNGSDSLSVYKNSNLVATRSMSVSNQDARVILFANSYNGNGGSEGTPNYSVATNAKMALARIGHGIPSQEFVTKMYQDELGLFQENAKCTLYGTSSAVTGLAYDDKTNVIHAGTSSGRSQFQGLTRINNTTTAVTTAISVSNELVAEQ